MTREIHNCEESGIFRSITSSHTESIPITPFIFNFILRDKEDKGDGTEIKKDIAVAIKVRTALTAETTT